MEKYNKKPEYWERAKKILRNNDPVLSRIISATPSNQYLTINKKPFETLANAIIGQQISVMAAASILRKLNSKIPSILNFLIISIIQINHFLLDIYQLIVFSKALLNEAEGTTSYVDTLFTSAGGFVSTGFCKLQIL